MITTILNHVLILISGGKIMTKSPGMFCSNISNSPGAPCFDRAICGSASRFEQASLGSGDLEGANPNVNGAVICEATDLGNSICDMLMTELWGVPMRKTIAGWWKTLENIGNPKQKWMITGGTPILGDHHLARMSCDCYQGFFFTEEWSRGWHCQPALIARSPPTACTATAPW